MKDVKKNISKVAIYFVLRIAICFVTAYMLFKYSNPDYYDYCYDDWGMFALLIYIFYMLAIGLCTWICQPDKDAYFRYRVTWLIIFSSISLCIVWFITNHPVIGSFYCLFELIYLGVFLSDEPDADEPDVDELDADELDADELDADETDVL